MKTITKNICPTLVTFAFTCFALSPMAQAVSPPPDGGYPGFNTAEGDNALFSLSSGVANTAVGWFSLKSDVNGSFNTGVGAGTLLLNVGDPTTGDGAENTAVGAAALLSNTTGRDNTANGAFALFSNTEGNENTANGSVALYNNTTANFNTATGYQALFSNTTGDANTANGFEALFSNTGGDNEGSFNTATGSQALFSNTTGRRNTADGFSALYSNTTGNWNTAVGERALYSNVIGSGHTAIGQIALYSNINGDEDQGGNTAIGAAALAANINGGGNTAVGNSALVNCVTDHYNIALGYVAGQNLTDGTNNIYISDPGVPAEENTIRIGNVVGFTDIYGFSHPAHTTAYIAGISGQTASSGVAVFVNTDGKLGTLTSSVRFKTDIKPMDNASEAILALKPVTFRYKREIDKNGIPQFGLVAEDVEKLNPDLIARDREGKPYSVRYEAVNAMLLNEFLKAHRKIDNLEALAAKQEKEIAELTTQLKEQASQIRKVNDKIELRQPAPELAANGQ